MGIKCGIDLVLSSRIKKNLQSEVFLKKLFHPEELNNMDPQHLAGIFAAKEAVMKALNMPPGSWLDILIIHDTNGKPKADILSDSGLSQRNCDLSISHDGDCAIAVFVCGEAGSV